MRKDVKGLDAGNGKKFLIGADIRMNPTSENDMGSGNLPHEMPQLLDQNFLGQPLYPGRDVLTREVFQLVRQSAKDAPEDAAGDLVFSR